MPFDWLSLAEASEQRKRRQRHRLSGIHTDEVSLVDNAANRKRFLTVKREDDMAQKTSKMTLDDGTTFDLNDDIDFGKSTPQRGATRKQLSIAAPVQIATVKMLSEGVERVIVVAKAVRGAKIVKDEKATSLPAPLAKELRSISAMVAQLTKQFDIAEPVSKAGHTDDCPEGTSRNAAGECVKTPDGTAGVKSKKIDKKVAKSAVSLLDTVIDDVETLRDAIDKMEVGEGADTPLPVEFGRGIVALANQLGSIAGRYHSPATKGFTTIEIEADDGAIAKAAEALVLTAEARTTLTDGIEKHLDGLTVMLRDVERMETIEVEDEDEQELPEFVGKGINEVATGLAEIAEGVTKDDDDDDDAADDADADADADAADADADDDADADADGDDADADDADADADGEGEGDGEGADDAVAKAEKVLAKAKAEAKKRAKAKKGAKSTTKKKGKTKKSNDDLAKVMKEAVEAAVLPLNEKIEKLAKQAAKDGKRLNKIAKSTPQPNAEPAGGDGEDDAERAKKAKLRKAAATVIPGIGLLSEDDVQKQMDDDLFFG